MNARAATGAIAVVAVTYSPGESLRAFLDTLATATNRPIDVVLADNGSTDGSVQAAAARTRMRVVETGGNVGYGRAANAGVRQTSAEFVVVANPDIEWEPGSLDQLMAAARRWPKGASFGPLIQTPEGAVYPSARALPSLGRGIGHAPVYVPSAVVCHTGGHATSRDAARMTAEHHRSAWRYLSRRYAGWRWLPLRVALRVGLGMRSMLASRVPRVAAGAAAQHRQP